MEILVRPQATETPETIHYNGEPEWEQTDAETLAVMLGDGTEYSLAQQMIQAAQKTSEMVFGFKGPRRQGYPTVLIKSDSEGNLYKAEPDVDAFIAASPDEVNPEHWPVPGSVREDVGELVEELLSSRSSRRLTSHQADRIASELLGMGDFDDD